MEIVWFLQKTIIMGILAPQPFLYSKQWLSTVGGFFYYRLFCHLENTKKKNFHIVPGENRDAGWETESLLSSYTPFLMKNILKYELETRAKNIDFIMFRWILLNR